MPARNGAGAPQATRRATGAATRRRGPALEAALLEAAWDELADVGYAAFTMDGVAVRAGTSRAVLYRRWPNRPQLLVDALRHHAQSTLLDVPDTGTLREDLLAYLRQISARVTDVTGLISFVIAGPFAEMGISPAVLRERTLADTAGSGTALIIERAIARGEIDPVRLTPRIRSLPVDLVRHEVIMTQQPVPDETLTEIVDRIFLPLVRS